MSWPNVGVKRRGVNTYLVLTSATYNSVLDACLEYKELGAVFKWWARFACPRERPPRGDSGKSGRLPESPHNRTLDHILHTLSPPRTPERTPGVRLRLSGPSTIPARFWFSSDMIRASSRPPPYFTMHSHQDNSVTFFAQFPSRAYFNFSLASVVSMTSATPTTSLITHTQPHIAHDRTTHDRTIHSSVRRVTTPRFDICRSRHAADARVPSRMPRCAWCGSRPLCG